MTYNRIYSHITALIVYPMYLVFALDLLLTLSTAALLSVYLAYFLLFIHIPFKGLTRCWPGVA